MVIVPVPENVIVPVPDHTVVEDKVKLPTAFWVPLPENVSDEPVVSIEALNKVPDTEFSVTVPVPELPLKITGLLRPGASEVDAVPPEAEDHLADDVAFQVPVPPTQYTLVVGKFQPVLFP